MLEAGCWRGAEIPRLPRHGGQALVTPFLLQGERDADPSRIGT